MGRRIPISRIYEMGRADPPVASEADARNFSARQDAWRKHGMAVLRLEDIRDDWTRQAIKNEAERLYGAR